MDNAIQKHTPQDLQAAPQISEFVSDWHDWLDLRVRAGEISQNTAAAYKRGMRKFTGFAEEAQTAEVIREWKAALLSDGYKPRTVNAWLAGVKSFFAWAAESGYLPYNPAGAIKGATRKGQTRKHVRDVLTDAEIRRVLAMPDDTPAGKRDAAILALFAFTGLRTVEVHRANLSDLQTRQGRYVLMVQGKGHTETDDFVILNELAEAALVPWLAIRSDKPGPLFTSLSNRNQEGRLSLPAIRALVKRYFRLAGVTGNKTTHSLRHTAITKMLRAGLSPVKVMSVSRHNDINTLMIYAHDVDRMDDPAENHIKYD
ncbi:MAG: tyrosine-type recombinase/integrase [Anaerolineales bacterium]|nr:tyrosine-type recombinase/integrase [Anaerolineales bacterium]